MKYYNDPLGVRWADVRGRSERGDGAENSTRREPGACATGGWVVHISTGTGTPSLTPPPATATGFVVVEGWVDNERIHLITCLSNCPTTRVGHVERRLDQMDRRLAQTDQRLHRLEQVELRSGGPLTRGVEA